MTKRLLMVAGPNGAGSNYVRHLTAAKREGYELHLTYLWLDSPNTAIERVAIRVQQGGHHIPKDVIIRRYRQGLHQLLHRYLPVMDVAFVVDGSSNQPGRPVIARKELGRPLEILNNDVWQRMVTYE